MFVEKEADPEESPMKAAETEDFRNFRKLETSEEPEKAAEESEEKKDEVTAKDKPKDPNVSLNEVRRQQNDELSISVKS